MRAALDTNTIVSGLLWGGKPGQVVDLITELATYRGVIIINAEQCLQRSR